MQLAMSSGVVQYEDDGNGPVLMFIHGDPGRPQDFRWLIPHLSASFRLIRIAMPGLDLTDLSVEPGVDIASRALFIRQFLDRLNIEKIIILGHSMGAALAIEHAVRWPDKTSGIILLNPVGIQPHKPFRSFRKNPFLSLLDTPLQPVLLPLLRRAFVMAGFPKGVSKEALLHLVRCCRAFDFQYHLHNVQSLNSPCLRIHSKDDPLIHLDLFKELNEMLKPGTMHIFEASGHNPQKTNPEQLALLIRQWAAQQELLHEK